MPGFTARMYCHSTYETTHMALAWFQAVVPWYNSHSRMPNAYTSDAGAAWLVRSTSGAMYSGVPLRTPETCV